MIKSKCKTASVSAKLIIVCEIVPLHTPQYYRRNGKYKIQLKSYLVNKVNKTSEEVVAARLYNHYENQMSNFVDITPHSCNFFSRVEYFPSFLVIVFSIFHATCLKRTMYIFWKNIYKFYTSQSD